MIISDLLRNSIGTGITIIYNAIHNISVYDCLVAIYLEIRKECRMACAVGCVLFYRSRTPHPKGHPHRSRVRGHLCGCTR